MAHISPHTRCRLRRQAPYAAEISAPARPCPPWLLAVVSVQRHIPTSRAGGQQVDELGVPADELAPPILF